MPDDHASRAGMGATAGGARATREDAPTTSEYDVLRAHLIAEHGYTDAYFDEDYPIGGPIRDIDSLRWLHAPSVKSRDYPKGCERL